MESAENTLDLKDTVLTIRQAFLSKIDGDAALTTIKGKLENGASLDDEDVMRLIILPLTKKGTEGKQAMIDEVIETSQKVQNEEEVSFILFAMMVAARNYISEKQMEKIKEVLTMTTVGKMFEDEKEQYAKDCATKARADDILEGLRQGKMIGEANLCVELVQKMMQTRNLSESEACSHLGIDLKYYKMSKAFIASQPEEEAV